MATHVRMYRIPIFPYLLLLRWYGEEGADFLAVYVRDAKVQLGFDLFGFKVQTRTERVVWIDLTCVKAPFFSSLRTFLSWTLRPTAQACKKFIVCAL